MKRILVLYSSKYGHTKHYAEMIADKLNADIFNMKDTKISIIENYDIIIYGGFVLDKVIYNLYKLMWNFEDLYEECDEQKNKKTLIVFADGMIMPNDKIVSDIIRLNFTDDEKEKVKFFYMPGGLNKETMQYQDELYIKHYIKEADKEPLNGYYQKLKRAYRRSFDFVCEKNIEELIEYVKSLL